MARKVSPSCVLPVKSIMRRLDWLRAAVNFVMTHGSALPQRRWSIPIGCCIGYATIYLEPVLRCDVSVILCWFEQRAGWYILE